MKFRSRDARFHKELKCRDFVSKFVSISLFDFFFLFQIHLLMQLALRARMSKVRQKQFWLRRWHSILYFFLSIIDGLVHIRIQQRNGRKTLTTFQGLSANYDLKKIVRTCKKVNCLLITPSLLILLNLPGIRLQWNSDWASWIRRGVTASRWSTWKHLPVSYKNRPGQARSTESSRFLNFIQRLNCKFC